MEVKKELESLFGARESSDSYVRLQIDIAEARESFLSRLSDWETDFPGKDTIRKEFLEGNPVVSLIPSSSPFATIKDFSGDIVDIFKKHDILPGDFLKNRGNGEKDLCLASIATACASHDYEALAESEAGTGLDKETLMLLGEETIKPLFHVIGRKARDIASFQDWSKGYCPVCGGTPDFGRFSKEEEGRRYLWCARCDTEWAFFRLRCPHCGNDNQKTLKFFTTDYREELRADVCEQCKGYVKTIDERKIEDPPPTCYVRENVASAYLDFIAEKNGFIIKFPENKSFPFTFTSSSSKGEKNVPEL